MTTEKDTKRNRPEDSPDVLVKAAAMSGNETVRAFARWLEGAFGQHGYPPELCGDLADLFWTLYQIETRLASILTTGEPRERQTVETELFKLQIEASEDIPMILKDIEELLNNLLGPLP